MKRLLTFFTLALFSQILNAQTVVGCTDPAASNYNPLAESDDNTCCYALALTVTCDQNADLNVFESELFSNLSTTVYPGTRSVCLQGTCFTLYCINYSAETALYSFAVSNGDSFEISVEPGQQQAWAWTPGTEPQLGCSDPTACNYNPTIACASFMNCNYDCYGCTDPTATNFTPGATVDNGTCCYGIDGCTDPFACNYDANATCSFNVFCDYACYGCTNPSSPSYNPSATIDDGSCCTLETYTTLTSTSGGYVYIFGSSNTSIGFYIAANEPYSFCLPEGCFTFDYYPEFLDNNNITFTMVRNGETLLNISQENIGTYFTDFSVNAEEGCIDPSACNFNPNANCYNYDLCDYSCIGCTDPNADNFNPNATVDNGTCCYEQYTIDAGTTGYWYAYDYLGTYLGGGYLTENNTLCAPLGCFNIYVYTDEYNQFEVSITNNEGNIVFSEFTNGFGYILIPFDINGVSGCTNPYACNYDPNATCPDEASCTYDCYGCIDPIAPNYNPDATLDNGTCCYNSWYTIEFSQDTHWAISSYTEEGNFYESGFYPEQNGFCLPEGVCFDMSVSTNDISNVSYSIFDAQGNLVASGVTPSYSYTSVSLSSENIIGCMYPQACNYNPNATCQDWYSCDYSCYGCTNPEAFNYDETATFDDGTCCTSGWVTFNADQPAYLTAYNGDYTQYASLSYPQETGFCSFDGCFTVYVYSYFSEPINFTLTDNLGNILLEGTTDMYGFFQGSIGIDGEIAGCTDSNACNYNPEATCNDGNCNYYCGGCLDANAINYFPGALFDDGSCFYTIEPPMMQLQTETMEAEEMYYVRMDVMSVGNGAPYIMMNSLNTQMNMI
ncbi:MAG: hypothetical protein ACOYLH_07045, partial [Flavobacteriales bacterium]